MTRMAGRAAPSESLGLAVSTLAEVEGGEDGVGAHPHVMEQPHHATAPPVDGQSEGRGTAMPASAAPRQEGLTALPLPGAQRASCHTTLTWLP